MPEDGTQTWHTPKSAPTDGTRLRIWIDECGGFEHSGVFYAKDSGGLPVFKDIHGGYESAALWRCADSAPRPSDELVAQSHAEFEEWDNAN
jgi:hypothetical protein